MSKAGERVVSGLVLLSCFTLLAWLTGRQVGVGAGQVALYILMGLILTCVFLAALGGLVLAVDEPLRLASGYTGAWDAVSRGFLVIVPFAVLALLSELVFKWGAAQAFTQAGIMTSGAAVGMELMKSGGQKIKYMVAPMVGALAFSGTWIAFTVIFQKVAR